MGLGIAQTAAQSGFSVLLADANHPLAIKGKDKIAQQLQKQCEKGKMQASEKESALSLISPVGSIPELRDCEFVVEAVSEQPELKFRLFRELDAAVREDAILASNTSSISITRIAA
ncbi:3-hydroxybutyryl-CoA dehydrogenase, partial [bacterium]|nr:3-hydroxybutyryl-CoA dehydrogenase [bacterium]